MPKGLARLSEAVTIWLNPTYGYATFHGSLPKHFTGRNLDTVRISQVGEACRSLVREAEGRGWFVAEGEPPYGGKLHRLDVAFDFGCADRSAVLWTAWHNLRLARNEKPAVYGRPTALESVAVLRRSRGGRWRIDHRAYDKGIEAGDDELNQLRLEMPMSAYRCERAGAKTFEGDLDAAAEVAWAALGAHGWWDVL